MGRNVPFYFFPLWVARVLFCSFLARCVHVHACVWAILPLPHIPVRSAVVCSSAGSSGPACLCWSCLIPHWWTTINPWWRGWGIFMSACQWVTRNLPGMNNISALHGLPLSTVMYSYPGSVCACEHAPDPEESSRRWDLPPWLTPDGTLLIASGEAHWIAAVNSPLLVLALCFTRPLSGPGGSLFVCQWGVAAVRPSARSSTQSWLK